MKVSQGTLSAQNLLGHTLDGKDWTVVEQLERAPCATGGNYSYGYAVDDGHGKLSFLKAFDFSSARNSPDPALAVQAMINAYVHERQVLQLCGNKGLSRVVRAIDSGMIQAPSEPGGMIFYLVFEQAEADVRSMHERMQRLDIAWRLSILHHVSVGLNQLHLLGIAHQDVKPSNILLYPALEAKLSDLGRACCKTIDTPHSEQAIAGDPDYAPPELLYGKIDPNWHQRRLGCDLYLLGSMAAYFFTGQATTHLLFGNVDSGMSWTKWAGSYEDVLPYLRSAFDSVVETVGSHISTTTLRTGISTVVRQLCEPDPRLRGHPADRGRNNNQFSLQRYMGQFNTWAHKARTGEF